MRLVPRDGGFNDLAERFAGIHLVVAPAFQHDQFLRFLGVRIERLAFVRRDQAVVVAGDEQRRARRNPVGDRFQLKTERIVDVFKRDFADGAGIATAAGSGEVRRQPIRLYDGSTVSLHPSPHRPSQTFPSVLVTAAT